MKSEFEFIESIKKKFSLNRIGDDCAVLPKDSKTDLVITTDLLVEDIDFRHSWTRPEFLGHKSLAVSLSDVAAMGAKPVWSMISIGVPEKFWKTDFGEKFYIGYMNLAKKYDVELIGGDVSKTPDKIVIDSIAAGEIKKGKAILRSGTKAGDLIFVSGSLGGAAAALKLLENDNKVSDNLFFRQVAPNPQIEIGQIIGTKSLATAMIDISDGLASDLSHICKSSGAGAKIFGEKIPIEPEIYDLKFQISALDAALYGGEDFELLFTVNPKKKFRLEKELQNHKFSLIGEITANKEIIKLIADGKSTVLEPKGFRHF